MRSLIVCFVLTAVLLGGCATSTSTSGPCSRSIIFPYEQVEVVEEQVPVSYIQEVEYRKHLCPDGTLGEILFPVLRESDEKQTIRNCVYKTTYYEAADIDGDKRADVIYLHKKGKLLYREQDRAENEYLFNSADHILMTYEEGHEYLLHIYN